MRSTGAIVLLVLVLLVGFAGCAGCGTFNSLRTQDEQVTGAWSEVENQYQRRADLVQQVVSTVQGQADFESETLQNVIEARSRATSIQISADDLDDPEALAQYQAAQSALGSSLGRLLAVSESYPTLQANEGFLRLQDQIEGNENRIATARRDYNQAATDLNARIRTFPANIVAGFAGVDRREQFEAAAGTEQAPEITFD
ncbi:LemA family protein [Rubrivirga marina]|uniref:LemA family protein n=1 Tax=Rubrivirga marina TaxID=1196024 RepID=A0A271IZF8_9BACT|nr:LemA family protein [Rubrivirga marina]PAP76457.1 LemA family protein [Rubrivirga marina]